MTRDYVLAPFAPENKDLEEEERNETWTASTTLYSLDLHCEAPTEYGGPILDYYGREFDNDFGYNYLGINGCRWPGEYIRKIGNETIGSNALRSNKEAYQTKKFSSFFVGYYSTDYSDWYLEGYCQETAYHTW
jgi:hypothetical protein